MQVKQFFLKILILIIILIFSFYTISFGDDIDNEIIDVNAEITENTPTPIPPTTINSRAYVVIDRNSNKILCQKNATIQKKMASTTKIMTATIILENCNLSETIEISKKAANTGGSRLGLKTGDKITIIDLLYGLMLRSGNDCAVALAEYAGGSISGFAELMNKKANELGLKNTHFETPHGLDSDEHYTTAYELALLTNYALNNKKFASIVATKTYTININGYPRTISNTNELLGNFDGVYGVKTGFTNGANRCLVTACKRKNLDIICVVLGADTKKFRTSDSIKLINYVFENFEQVNIQEKIEKEFETWKSHITFSIEKGISQELDIKISSQENLYIPLLKNTSSKIYSKIDCQTNLKAPILVNQPLGKIELFDENNEILATSTIYANNTIMKKNIFDYITSFFKNFNSYINVNEE